MKSINRQVYGKRVYNEFIKRLYVRKRFDDITEGAREMGTSIRRGLLVSVVMTTLCAKTWEVRSRFSYFEILYRLANQRWLGVSIESGTKLYTLLNNRLYVLKEAGYVK